MGLFSRKSDVAELKASSDFEGLADVLKTSDDEQRRNAVEAIAELGDPAAVAPIVSMMGRLRTRAESYESAEEAIGRLGPAAVDPLVSLVRKGELAAASQLARLGESIALEPLRDVSRDPDPGAREAAFGGLNELATPDARAILAEAIESGAGRKEALFAVRVQAGGGDPRIIRAVFTALRESADLRDEAIGVLNSLARRIRDGEVGPDVLTELVAATGDGDPDVRVAALLALGAATPEDGQLHPQTAEAMLAALSDENEGVRVVGARALSEAGDHRAYDALVSLLPSDNEQVVAGAAAGLGDLGDPSALPAIRERIESRSDLSNQVTLLLCRTRDDLKKKEKQLAKGG
ncbi:MAG TPA: HEAT repeat domain-containing protein [Solirubrobacterales bacterium]